MGAKSDIVKQALKLVGEHIAPGTEDYARNLDAFYGNTHPNYRQRYYAGTSKDKDFTAFQESRHGTWLTSNPSEASNYALDNDSQNYVYDRGQYRKTNTASRVIPSYARVENPYTGELPDFAKTENYKKAQSDWFDELRAQGYDAWAPDTNKGDLLVVLKDQGTNVKSAIGNNGQFDRSKKHLAKAGGGAIDDALKLAAKAIAGGAEEVAPKLIGIHPQADDYTRKLGDYLNARNPDMPIDPQSIAERRQDMGFNVDAYHGSPRDIHQFSNTFSTPEGYWGGHHYATSSPLDASVNYATRNGADLVNRLGSVQEQFLDGFHPEDVRQWYEEKYGKPLDGDPTDSHLVNEWSQDAAADALGITNHGAVYPLALRMKNPVRMDSPNQTFWDHVIEQDDNGDIISEGGPAADLLQHTQDAMREYGLDDSEIADVIGRLNEELYNSGGIDAGTYDALMRKYTISGTDDNGNMVSPGHIMSDVFQRMGHDSIDMPTDVFAPSRFKNGMQGTGGDTRHYIIFDPKNIRSRFGLFDPFKANSARLSDAHGGRVGKAGGGSLVDEALKVIRDRYDDGGVVSNPQQMAFIEDAKGNKYDVSGNIIPPQGIPAQTQSPSVRAEKYDPYADEVASAKRILAEKSYDNQGWGDWLKNAGQNALNVGSAFLPKVLGGTGEVGVSDLVKGAYNSAKSGLTLPGDALAGNVQVFDPQSGAVTDEVLRRGSDFTGMVTLGAGAIPAEANSLRMGAKGVPPKSPQDVALRASREAAGVTPDMEASTAVQMAKQPPQAIAAPSAPDLDSLNPIPAPAGITPPAPEHALTATRGERTVIAPTSIKLTPQEQAVVNSFTSRADRAIVASRIRETKARYPKSDGWAPFEAVGASFDDKGNPVIQWKEQTYGFNTSMQTGNKTVINPETGQKEVIQVNEPRAMRPGTPAYETAARRATRNGVAAVEDVIRRAAEGDQNALRIIRQAGWYREFMRKGFDERGGSYPAFSDLLGATSPNTAVDQNYRYAHDIQNRFARGDFDERAAFARDYQGSLNDFPEDKLIYRDPVGPKGPQKLQYGMNSRNAQMALADKWRQKEPGQAPKARNFSGNLGGATDQATIDVWAARFINRMMGRKRLPPAVESGVKGKLGSNLDPTGEFGFGQDVFRRITDDLNRRGNLLPYLQELGYDRLTPMDMQALTWFIEKEHWTRNNWTTAAGEGGSFEDELAKYPSERWQSGVSIQQDTPPSDEAMAAARNVFENSLRDDPDVNQYRVHPTIGRYAGNNERSFDLELTAKPGWNPRTWMASVIREAKTNNQYDVFFSKRLDPRAAQMNPNARPGVEIYFRDRKSLGDALPILEEFTKRNADGFTFVTDLRLRERELGGKEAPDFVGVRMQWVPEIRMRWDDDFRNGVMADPKLLDTEKVSALNTMQDAIDALDKAGLGVVDARVHHYDTLTVGRESYDNFLDGIAQPDNAAGHYEGRAGKAVDPLRRLGKPLHSHAQGRDRALRAGASTGQPDVGRSMVGAGEPAGEIARAYGGEIIGNALRIAKAYGGGMTPYANSPEFEWRSRFAADNPGSPEVNEMVTSITDDELRRGYEESKARQRGQDFLDSRRSESPGSYGSWNPYEPTLTSRAPTIRESVYNSLPTDLSRGVATSLAPIGDAVNFATGAEDFGDAWYKFLQTGETPSMEDRGWMAVNMAPAAVGAAAKPMWNAAKTAFNAVPDVVKGGLAGATAMTAMPDDAEAGKLNLFSRLGKSIEELPMEKMSAEQALSMLSRTSPASELKWTGMLDYLRDNPKVNKSALINHLEANKVEPHETILGGGVMYPSQLVPRQEIRDKYASALDEARRERTHWSLVGGKDANDRAFQATKRIWNIEKKMRDEELAMRGGFDPPPRYEGWSTGDFNKDSYREHILTLPGNPYVSPHYGNAPNEPEIPGYIAHMRGGVRSEDGKRVYIMDEAQSDLAQALRKEGPIKLGDMRIVNQGNGYWGLEMPGGNFLGGYGTPEHAQDIMKKRVRDYTPYTDNTDDWTDLAVKRAIQAANEGDATHIAWPTGRVQNDRYDMRHQMNALHYTDNMDGTYTVSVETPEGDIHDVLDTVPGDEVRRTVGDNLWQRIQANEGRQHDYLPNSRRLPMNGEVLENKGMNKFYDEIVPKRFSTVTKKATGEKVNIGKQVIENKNGRGDYHIMPLTDALRSAKFSSFDRGGTVERALALVNED